MSNVRRVIFMLIAIMALMIPNVKGVKAAMWHNTHGYWWKVDKICKDGAQVTVINPMNNDEFELAFTAYLTPVQGPTIPTMLAFGQFVPLDQEIGGATVQVSEQRTSYMWDDANWDPQKGSTRFWGVNAIQFPQEFSSDDTVAVQLFGTDNYTFIGAANSNCTVK